jgi:energy-coupling factor transporter ATP-binding protein EcfA2
LSKLPESDEEGALHLNGDIPDDFKIRAKSISVRDWLKPTSLEFIKGDAVLITGGSDYAKTGLSLILSGHMRSFRGTLSFVDINLDRGATKRALRRISAVVDAPRVSTPYEHTKLRDYVAQELCIAKRPSGSGEVGQFLIDGGLQDYADSETEEVPTGLYLDATMSLATMREGVRVLHLVLPDRYDCESSVWQEVVDNYHNKGYTVLAYCQGSSSLGFCGKRFEMGVS